MAYFDQLNSTTAPQALAGGATFTGAWRDLTEFAEFTILLTGDSGAPGTLCIEQSVSSVTVDKTRQVDITDIATFPAAFDDVTSRFFRVRYVNGVTPLTTFQCQTLLHPKKTKSHLDRNSAANPLYVQGTVMPLPAGASTEAKQDDQIAQIVTVLSDLTSILAKLNDKILVTHTGVNPIPVNTAVKSISAGDNNIGNVDVASSALPTGASTEAKQDTGNSSLASIETNTSSAADVLTEIRDTEGIKKIVDTVTARIQDASGVDIGYKAFTDSQHYLATAGVQSVYLDTANSSTTNLDAGNSYTFTGTAVYNIGAAVAQVKLFADKACTVKIQQSDNGTNWDIEDSYTTVASTGFSVSVRLISSRYRVVVTTASETTTTFRLYSTLMPIAEALPRSLDANGNLKTRASIDQTTDGTTNKAVANAYNSKTSTYLPIRQDGATNALQTIDYSHHEIHSGSHFFVIGVQDLSINQVLDFTWLMPNTTKWTHFTWKFDTESETAWYVYETAVETNALSGTITPLNNDRNSATTSGTTMKYEVQANLVAANADTDVTTATLLESGICGSGKTGGSESRESEIIMKQNTLYCLRAIATAAGYINFSMQFYEHVNVS